MVNFNWYTFDNLTTQQLYSILTLRSAVFVVEQNCIYMDPDGKDEGALHLLGEKNNVLLAYLRIFPPSKQQNNIIFGRVVTAKHARQQGLGKKLMTELMQFCEKHYKNIPIQCSAQKYLISFYETFGFISHGDIYVETGIPHVLMTRGK